MEYSSLFKSIPNLVHGFSGRNETPENVYCLQQIHSDQVHVLEDPNEPTRTIQADAVITSLKNKAIGIRTADCLPILLVDKDTSVIAGIHAGWRGLVGGVIEKTLGRLQSQFKVVSQNLVAVLGIRLCLNCFEVGPEVFEIFQKKWGDVLKFKTGKGDRMHLDLSAMAAHVLKTAGLTQIEILPHCTLCNSDLFYSYRGGEKDFRNISWIKITVT